MHITCSSRERLCPLPLRIACLQKTCHDYHAQTSIWNTTNYRQRLLHPPKSSFSTSLATLPATASNATATANISHSASAYASNCYGKPMCRNSWLYTISPFGGLPLDTPASLYYAHRCKLCEVATSPNARSDIHLRERDEGPTKLGDCVGDQQTRIITELDPLRQAGATWLHPFLYLATRLHPPVTPFSVQQNGIWRRPELYKN